MRTLFVLALALPFAACTVGDASEEPIDPGEETNDHPNEGSGSGSGSGTGEGVAGDIASDTTWTGATRIKGATTIKPGVTVTVEAGATLSFASGAGILVEGTLTVAGTSAAKVNLQPETGTYWSGIEVTGTYNATYALQKGGAIRLRANSNLKVVDSKMWGVGGDLLIANGGNVDVSYSNIGADPGTTDTTHCQLHFNSGVGSIKINNSNINSAPYGLMYYGGINADFKNNNWFGNGIDVDTQMGAPVSGDFSGSYFDESPPTPANGSTLTLANLAAAKLVDAGPRP